MIFELEQQSKKVLDICERHYVTWGKGNGCDKCPIQRECHSAGPLSLENHNAWVRRVNAAAESAAAKESIDEGKAA
ncbi:hypothetical protein [Chromobacterium violaceum]